MTAGGATTAVSEHDHTVPIPRQPEPVSPEPVSSDAVSPAPGEPLAAAEDQLADPAHEPAATVDTEPAVEPAEVAAPEVVPPAADEVAAAARWPIPHGPLPAELVPETRAVEPGEPERPADRAIVASAPVSGRHDGRAHALTQLACLLSGLLAAAVGALRLSWPGLWGDELATWGMTTVSWDELGRLLGGSDVVIGPYYALVKGWTTLAGSSDVALRVPSVAATAVTAMLIAALGSRLASPRVGFVAGLLFAVVPAVSRYAQEARPYALVTMFAVLATLLLTRLAERRGAGRVVAYGASVAALGLLHPLALSLLAAHVVVVLVAERQAFARWAAGAVAGAVPGGVLLWLGYRQQSQVSWIPLARLSSLAEYPGEVFGAALGAGVLLALALFAVSLRRPAVVYSAWALVPTALVFAAGTAIPLWLPRYLLFTIPAWVLLAATALGRYPVIRGLVAIAAVTVLAVPAQSQLRAVDGHSQDTRQLAALIASLSRPGDGIVYGTLDRGGGWIGRDTVAHYVPAEQQPTDLLAERPQRTGGHLLAAECVAIVKCLGRADRVWLVRVGETDNPLAGIGKPKMEAFTNYDVVKTWRPRGFTLALLLRRPG